RAHQAQHGDVRLRGDAASEGLTYFHSHGRLCAGHEGCKTGLPTARNRLPNTRPIPKAKRRQIDLANCSLYRRGKGQMVRNSREGFPMRKSLAAMLGAAALFATTAIANAQGTVKIGLIMPFSGQFADTAAQMDNAIKLYIKEHGDTVAGKKIEL